MGSASAPCSPCAKTWPISAPCTPYPSRPPNASGWTKPPCISRTGFLPRRSEEHTSELQSLMRISYAVFCLKKKNKQKQYKKLHLRPQKTTQKVLQTLHL